MSRLASTGRTGVLPGMYVMLTPPPTPPARATLPPFFSGAAPPNVTVTSISRHPSPALEAQLMELAHITGAQSRFGIDPNISQSQYRALCKCLAGGVSCPMGYMPSPSALCPLPSTVVVYGVRERRFLPRVPIACTLMRSWAVSNAPALQRIKDAPATVNNGRRDAAEERARKYR